MQEQSIKEKIMDATIIEFNEKGLKFTMDDIAKRLEMSKKTIYTVFQDKESLCMETVNYCFNAIKESEQAIIEDETLSLQEKIRRTLIVLPDRYQDIDFRKIYGGKEKYPKIYQEIMHRLSSGWEPTIALLEEGIATGQLRKFSVSVFKSMVESSINGFMSGNELLECDVTYEEALEEMLEILWNGIENGANHA